MLTAISPRGLFLPDLCLQWIKVKSDGFRAVCFGLRIKSEIFWGRGEFHFFLQIFQKNLTVATENADEIRHTSYSSLPLINIFGEGK